MIVTDSPRGRRADASLPQPWHHHRPATVGQAGHLDYEMADLGYNYRLTDFQCALGRSQLCKLPGWIERRREIAGAYDAAFAGMPPYGPWRCGPMCTTPTISMSSGSTLNG